MTAKENSNPLTVTIRGPVSQSPPLIEAGITPAVLFPSMASTEDLSKNQGSNKGRKGELGLDSWKDRSFKGVLLDPGKAHSNSKLWALSQAQNQDAGLKGPNLSPLPLDRNKFSASSWDLFRC